MTLEDRKKIATRFVSELGTGKIAEDLVTDYFTAWTGSSGKLEGAQYRAGLARLKTVFKAPMQLTIKLVTAEENRVAVQAASEGALIDDNVYKNDYHFLFEFEGDRISTVSEYMNTKTVSDVLMPLLFPKA